MINISSAHLRKSRLYNDSVGSRDCKSIFPLPSRSSFIIFSENEERMSDLDFSELVQQLISKLDTAFEELKKANDQGKIALQRVSPTELIVKVQKIGNYRIYSDPSQQFVYLQSPQSGLFNYKYDSQNGQWKSQTQIHIVEELLMREFITFSKGTLNL
jgi:frataxin-like iron-binding protein CyaY